MEDTVQGVSEKSALRVKNTASSQSCWVITENTHEPIISKVYEVQRIGMKKKSWTPQRRFACIQRYDVLRSLWKHYVCKKKEGKAHELYLQQLW